MCRSGCVFESIPIRIQSQSHHTQHQNLPQINTCTTSRLFIGQSLLFEQPEDRLLECRMHPDPLQASQNGRQLIMTLAQKNNLLNRSNIQAGLGIKSVAHPRMLQRLCPFSQQLPIGYLNIHTL